MEAPLVWIYDKPPGSRVRYGWWRFVERHLPMLVIYLLVATLIGVILAPFMLVTVPSGYVGVLWKRFGGGTVLNPRKLKDEGMRLTLPWNRVFLYDLRLQSVTETYNAISRDGISLTASINIRYRLKREAVPQLHQSIGPNYVEALVVPEIGNRTRQVMAAYTAEDIYSTKRAEIQTKIRALAEAMLGEHMMVGGRARTRRTTLRTAFRSTPCSTSSTRSSSASSYQVPWLPPSIARLSSITFRRNTSFASPAKSGSLNAKRSKPKGSRISADRQPGDLRLLPAVAGHRSDTSAGAIVQFQNRDCRHRQRRVAGHSGQRGCCPLATTGQ